MDNSIINNTLPLISVVIPTYNRADTIQDCIKSILKQTYDNIEIIIIDDCSTDRTEEIVKSVNDQRVRYVRLNKNMRACYARNFGADQARGTYVAFQDSDDIWHEDKLQIEYDTLVSNKVDFVFCGMNKIDLSGNKSGYFPEARLKGEIDYYKQELKHNIVSTQTILMKKEIINDIRFDETLRKYQDWDFAIRVSAKYKMKYIPVALVDYRLQTNSVSVTVSHFEAYMRIFEKYRESIHKYPDIEAYFYSGFGDCFRDSEPNKAIDYYLKSIKIHFCMKTTIKYFFTKFRLMIGRKG